MERVTRIPMGIMVRLYNLIISKFFPEKSKNSNFWNQMPGIIFQLEIKAHTCHCTRLQILVVGIIFMLIQDNIRQITKITTFYFFSENTLKLTIFCLQILFYTF